MIKVEDLDITRKEYYKDFDNIEGDNKTFRECLRESEKKLKLDKKDLNSMEYEEIQEYINYIEKQFHSYL